jgi:beta-lactamase class A
VTTGKSICRAPVRVYTASAMVRKIIIFLFILAGTMQGFAQCCPQKPQKEKREVLWQKLKSELRHIDQELDGVMAVAVKDLTSGEEFLIRGDEIMPQASSIKIAVLAELYLQAQQGKLKLTDEYVVRKDDLVGESYIMGGLTPGVTRLTLRDLATMMIAVSDNSATNVLIDRVGMENVNAMLEGMGFHNTRLRRKMLDLKAAAEGRENVSTAREMMTLLETVYAGKLLNKEMTADFIKMLSTHKESSMLQGLPDDAVAANKPGELEAVRNDSGIVLVKNRPYILCVMTAYLRDEREGSAAIRKIAALTYSYFDRVARASEYGRVVSPK